MLVLLLRILIDQPVFIRSLVVLKFAALDCSIWTHYCALPKLLMLKVTFKLLTVLIHLPAFTVSLVVEELALVEEIAAIILAISFFDPKKIELVLLLNLAYPDLLEQLVVIFVTENKALAKVDNLLILIGQDRKYLRILHDLEIVFEVEFVLVAEFLKIHFIFHVLI